MADNKGSKDARGFIIAYKDLGTINIDELVHALVEDLHMLKDSYNVQYLRGASLKFYPTDEYGQSVRIMRPTGGSVEYVTTQHYRPACKDYDL